MTPRVPPRGVRSPDVSLSERDTTASGGLERAAAILDAFDPAHRELTLAALVRRSGLPRSTTHRLADRMLALGWLDKPHDRYRIGNRLFELSGLAPIRTELRESVLPFMQDLYNTVRTTVQLGVLDGSQVLIVEKIAGHRPMPMLSQVGGTVPTFCSALGRALLAYSPRSVVDAVLAGDLPARTPRTLTNPAAIRRELAAMPDRGWAVEREEGNIGVTCVAAPIFGPDGTVAAAVSITGPTGLVRPDRAGPAVRLVAAAASRAFSKQSR
ncbi:IclR family transcriptional regulator [Cryptosporangium phraense]|uniref:IclR family transcriptional regulator n=1 Tax=Cryptosporangium phraense TaxID=2593070 RepID=A0A545AQT4_9ACTN|nr:IclR family transcriptional regulator [Cryptosporangium phraense]